MSEFELKYEGTAASLFESVGKDGYSTTTNIRPTGCESGWFYLHSQPKDTWATYHVSDVETIEISDLYPRTLETRVLVIQTLNTRGERVTVFLNNVTLDMIADAIGCEQMAIQATEQEGLLA